MSDRGSKTEIRPDEELKTVHKLQEPDMYRVIMHNDHYTTMEFVVEVLVTVFRKQPAEATQIMMDIHKKGQAQVGVFTLDIARTKVEQVHQLARKEEYPLRCSYEPV